MLLNGMTGDHAPCESRLELDRLWLADVDPTVPGIAAQPMQLPGCDGDDACPGATPAPSGSAPPQPREARLNAGRSGLCAGTT